MRITHHPLSRFQRSPAVSCAGTVGVSGRQLRQRKRLAKRDLEISHAAQDSGGSQFTTVDFLNVLRRRQIDISMDGQGCWRGNVFVERLWRSVKYEEVYLHAYETVSDISAGLSSYFEFFNNRRPHQALTRRTPNRVYGTALPEQQLPSPRAIPLISAA